MAKLTVFALQEPTKLISRKNLETSTLWASTLTTVFKKSKVSQPQWEVVSKLRFSRLKIFEIREFQRYGYVVLIRTKPLCWHHHQNPQSLQAWLSFKSPVMLSTHQQQKRNCEYNYYYYRAQWAV